MATPVANSVPLLTAVNNGNGTLTDEFISGLVQGGLWTFGGGPRVLTYSFSINDTLVSQWTQGQMGAFVQALTGWSNVANIAFVETGSGGVYTQSTADIAATLTGNELQTQLGGVGIGFFPDPSFVDLVLSDPEDPYNRGTWPKPEGDVFFDDFSLSFSPGSSGYEVMLHEIGHALGLKHSGDDGYDGVDSPIGRPTFAELGIASYDTSTYTLMGGGALGPGPYAVTPMLLDILAIQHIYGANMSYHTGNDTYTFNSSSFQAIWDAGGIDTLDASAQGSAVSIDLRPGQSSQLASGFGATTAIAFNVTIENAIGSQGEDTIIGNDAANTLNGGPGIDRLEGGTGNDTYVIDAADTAPLTFFSIQGQPGDWVSQGQNYVVTPGVGMFQITASDSQFDADGLVDMVGVVYNNFMGSSWSLAFSTTQLHHPMQAGVYVDVVRFDNSPSALDGHPGLEITGNGHGVNSVTGNFTVSAASFDYSGPTPEVQTFSVTFEQHSDGALPGLFGSLNINVPGAAADVPIEIAGAGIDTVRSELSYALPRNIENLTLTGSSALSGTGNELNNILTGNDGDNVLAGGDSVDTALYAGLYRQYLATGDPTGSASIDGPEGTDSLASIETLSFVDGSLNFDPYSHIAQVHRVYEAMLNRAGDVLGVNYHTGRLDSGVSLPGVALDFVGSPEFQSNYGSLNNTQFVELLYQNVLHRAADGGGLAYWTGLMASGWTKGDVTVSFSESLENVGNHAAQINAGIWDIDEVAASVARLYWGTLDRAPDAGGLIYWTNLVQDGYPIWLTAGNFMWSAEFLSNYGSLDNDQFVNQLYLNVLDRPADPDGLAYWTGLLNGGASRVTMTLGFTESYEFQVKMIAQIDQGITATDGFYVP